MVGPQVVDGGMTFNMERSCAYIEYAVMDSHQEVVLQLGG